MLNFSTKFVHGTTEYSTFYKHARAPIFRKTVNFSQKPQEAEILITGLGFYQLFVNGTDITKGFLAPYISNPDDIVYYDSYNLVPYLSQGENVIAILLGDGMQNLITNVWNFDKTKFTSAPKLALTFNAKNENETVSFEADSFKWTDGPITFNNTRCGIHYDARLEPNGWFYSGYDDSSWNLPIKAEMPRGELRICKAEPIAVRSEFSPISVYSGKVAEYTARGDVTQAFPGKSPEGNPPITGGYVYDFGKNSAGVFRLKIKNTFPGQKISIQCCERKSPDGDISYRNINFFPDGYCQRDIYICKGADEEIFVPMFVYHGYRYLYVHGITEAQATKDLLTYIEINTQLSDTASFNCSDSISNTIYNICDNSDKSNFHYFPTDCPHREKNGWTGDAAASAEHMIMTMSVENSWREWMNNIRKAQNTEGYIPGIIPTTGWGFAWGNGPAWDRVIFDLPYYTYIYRGTTEMITENASMMLRYLELLTRKLDSKGLIQHWGLGDWCPNDRNGADKYAVPLGFTNGVMITDMCQKATVMFKATGLELHAEFARKLGEKSRKAIRNNYIDFGTMTVDGCYQSGQAMAVYYNIFEEAEKKQAVEILVDLIHKNNNRMSVGYLGARCIFHVLSSYGYSDLAYKMITRTDASSYGAVVANGLTTLPEYLSTVIFKNDKAGSLNHHFFGDIKHWYLRSVAGINVNPALNNPNEILIKPYFIESLNYAEASYKTPNGSIYVKWQRDGETIKLTVTKTENAVFNVKLPNGWAFAESKLAWYSSIENLNEAILCKSVL